MHNYILDIHRVRNELIFCVLVLRLQRINLFFNNWITKKRIIIVIILHMKTYILFGITITIKIIEYMMDSSVFIGMNNWKKTKDTFVEFELNLLETPHSGIIPEIERTRELHLSLKIMGIIDRRTSFKTCNVKTQPAFKSL